MLFPAYDPELYETPVVEQGPYEVIEYRIDLPIAADGSPSGITVIKPDGVSRWQRLPMMLWTMGSNVQSHYQQELHQTLASYGYAVVIPDTRPLTFIPDLNYHGRNVALGQQALRLASWGFLGFRVDRDSIAVGGYSIGGSLATFIAAEESSIDAIVMWGALAINTFDGENLGDLLILCDGEESRFTSATEYAGCAAHVEHRGTPSGLECLHRAEADIGPDDCVSFYGFFGRDIEFFDLATVSVARHSVDAPSVVPW